MTRWVLLLLLIVPRLGMVVSPHACLAPCAVRVSVQVRPHVENRWLVIQIDGPTFQGSRFQLDGEDSPFTQPALWFPSLPTGEYTVLSLLYGPTREVMRVQQAVVVR